MDNQYIRRLRIQKKSIGKRLYAAICLVLVAALLVSATSYAWLVLSRAPEVTDVTTSLGANGNLEIALATTDHLASLEDNNMYDVDSSFEYATGDVVHDNVLWGNLIDLTAVDYGLHVLNMRPAILNIKDGCVADAPVSVGKYDADGRLEILDLSTENINLDTIGFSGVYHTDKANYYAGSVTMSIDDLKSGNYDKETLVQAVLDNREYGVRIAGPLDYSAAVNQNQNSANIDLLVDGYCFAIDLLFRTNAPSGNLMLQTEGTQRVESELEDEYVGSGSFIEMDNERLSAAMKVVFANTLTGEVYAVAQADSEGKLWITARADENGDLVPTGADDAALIKPLTQNQVSAVTAWVFVDGNQVDNSAAATEEATAMKLSLQFSTDAVLNPAYTDINTNPNYPTRPEMPNNPNGPMGDYEDMVISILGDSISTFAGYIPTADGVNLEHKSFYPNSTITTVEQTWWMQVITELDATLGINDSWSGSRVLNTMDGNSDDLGEDAAMASMTRIQNLGSNGTPNVILFFGGTNDIAFDSPLGSFEASTAPVETDLTTSKWNTYADAYVDAIMRLKHFYPEALILAIFPTENVYYYDAQTRETYTSLMASVCDHYGVSYIDPMEEGFEVESMLADVTHPNVSGMEFIADMVVEKLLSEHLHSFTASLTAPNCTERGYTTHACSCGYSYVDDYVDATGKHSYDDGACTHCGVHEWDTDGDGALEILAIGNSFSVDALEYAYQIAQDLGVEEIVLGNLYIGGCSLNTHATNVAGDLAKYTYYYNDNGSWKTTSKYKISTALESRSWDFVSLQQASNYSGVESTYNKDLTNLITYVQERSDAKLVWHMTWAYQQNSTHSAFPTYNKDQMTMYNAIVSAVQNKIVTNSDIDLIVPNGTAVQNSRTSLLGDTTTRDGYHMSYDYGRYLTGLAFIKTLTGLDISSIDYAPSGVSELDQIIAMESVNNACAAPFAVTDSSYTGEAPADGYILLQPELYQGAYWWPINQSRYNVVNADQDNSYQYYTFPRFTREDLPVGSIIMVRETWKYRPDGWVTDTVQTATREEPTSVPYVVVTDEWWGDYTIRSFNVSNLDLRSIMDLTEEEMRSIFRIYVPEESHVHKYVDGKCRVCGAQ